MGTPADSLESGPPGPVGLGGWLALVFIGLVFSIGKTLLNLNTMYLPIFRDGTWEKLTTPGQSAYDPLWMPMLLFEILWNVASIALCVYLVVLFVRRSSFFPKIYIALCLSSIFFIILDARLATRVRPDLPMFDPDTAKELGRSLISSLIWVPYMLRSVRVKNTFVVSNAA